MIDRRTFLKSGAAAIVAAGVTPACAPTSSTPDVVIVGGGFAGVTAARELTMRGRSAVLVEARDRLGGRTYTADHDGHAMELGGTWVHPAQPNVWAEINRYGLETEVFPVPGAAASGRVRRPGRRPDDDAVARAVEAFDQFCAPGASCSRRRTGDRGGRTRRATAIDRCASTSRPCSSSPLCATGWRRCAARSRSARSTRSAATEILRTYALAGWSVAQMMAALTATKLVKGTRALIESIAAQATLADIRLNSPVRRVVQTGERVRVELASGDDSRAPHRRDHAADERAEQRGVRAPPVRDQADRGDRTARGLRPEVLRARQGRHRQRRA